MLLLMCVGYLLNLFHAWVVNFHQLFLGLLIDGACYDEVGQPVLWSEAGYVRVASKGQHVIDVRCEWLYSLLPLLYEVVCIAS